MSTPVLTPISRRRRFLASVLLIGMLLAIFVPPLAFQTRGVRGLSPSVGSALTIISPVSQLLYLDRGYAFFAPDPGPSHLIRIITDGGQVTRLSPNLDDQWPRLLYHRHFMLSEFLNDSYQPDLPLETSRLIGPELTPEELQTLRLGRTRYEAIADSMLRHARLATGDNSVTLERVEHQMPDFVVFEREGLSLTDERSYVTLTDEPITIESLLGNLPALPQPPLGSPEPPSESVPTPEGEKPNVNDEPGSETDE